MRYPVFRWLVCASTACAIGIVATTGAGGDGIASAQPRESKAAGAGSGTVRDIDRAGSRVKLDHGPLPSIGMPAMTMTFKVKNPALLDGLKRGDRVNFEIERSGLGWIVTNLEREEQSKR